MMPAAGADLRSIADLLGHSSVSFSQDRYGHRDAAIDAEVLARLERLA